MGIIPARVNRNTGELTLNPLIWDRLPAWIQEFILDHERGHLLLQTDSEQAANQYAYEQMLNTRDYSEATAQILFLEALQTDPDINKKIRDLLTHIPNTAGRYESNIAPAIIGAVVAIGTAVYQGISSKKAKKDYEAYGEEQRRLDLAYYVDQIIMGKRMQTEQAEAGRRQLIYIIIGVIALGIMIFTVLLIKRMRK